MKDIEKRIAENIQVPEDMYLEGLLDITGSLFSELTQFLENEHRYIGITKSYIHTVKLTIERIDQSVRPEDIEIYGRILYLYKPFLKKEFKRLRNKKLTAGDSVIVIINKIIEIIVQEKKQDFRFHKEVRTLRKIISKFFENIRNKKKEDPLYSLSNAIKEYKDSGSVGKYPLDVFSFIDNQYIKEELKDPGERLKEESDNKINEISFDN